MPKAIKHFMWGYQLHFRIKQEVSARSLFKLLDQRFDPEVFLVGMLTEDSPRHYPACVEPENDFWVPSEAFDGVLSTANTLSSTYPESQLAHSHPLAAQWQAERLRKRAVQETISKIIAEHPDKPNDMRCFPSFPMLRDGYLVAVVLGLQGWVIDSHARLTIDRADIDEYRSFKVAVSLIDAAVDEFLADAASELVKPDAGAGWGSGKSPAEMMRAAGNRLIMDSAYRADPDFDQAGFWDSLFDACNAISSLKYEQTAGKGRMIIARRDHPALEAAITFSQPVDIHNSRAARKLLELASRGLALHMNARSIFGLAEVGSYEAQSEDLYEINVLDHHHWELGHAGQSLMRVQSGQPRLPAPLFNAPKLRKDIGRVFRGLAANHAADIVRLVEGAAKEKHGTMLVVVDDAAGEAKRLAKQATCIEPFPLTPESLTHLTPIDGAVLISPDATCHAIGVILDGLATDKGNPARGARFNSAVRYVETHNRPCLAVVVSEDGGVDLVPDLLPAIRPSEIDQVIADLEVILGAPSVNTRRYNKLTQWLENRAFYLLEEHCAKINDVVKRIDDRIAKENPRGFHIIRKDFVPNSALDPDLYYDEE